MRPGEREAPACFDLEIQMLAEEGLGVDRTSADVVTAAAFWRLLGDFDILRPYGNHYFVVPAQTVEALHFKLAQRRGDAAAAIPDVSCDDGGVKKVRGANEIGDEPVARTL